LEEHVMHGLDTLNRLNTEAAIKGILARAEAAGVALTRAEVLEELKYREDDDVSQWEAVVAELVAEPAQLAVAA
jgi:hypothetical protein